jgi:hypothetical protein
LTKETGLSFIPLYSPSSRRPLSPSRSYHDLSDIAESPSVTHDPDDDSFKVEEITLFQTRDISGDKRYEQWLSKYHPKFVRPLEFHSASVAKYLTCSTCVTCA